MVHQLTLQDTMDYQIAKDNQEKALISQIRTLELQRDLLLNFAKCTFIEKQWPEDMAKAKLELEAINKKLRDCKHIQQAI